MTINPLNMSEVAEIISNQTLPTIPGTATQNGHLESYIADNVQELVDITLNHLEIRAGRAFEKDGELVVEPLGTDHRTLLKDSEVDRYVIRLDLVVARDTRMHYELRDAEQKIGEQLKLW